jgi:hypothetical protein
MRMIRQMVMAMLGRVHNDGRPAMGFVLIGMHDIRFGVVIRSALWHRHSRQSQAKR